MCNYKGDGWRRPRRLLLKNDEAVKGVMKDVVEVDFGLSHILLSK